jgi:hypothetical protein
MIVRQYKRCGAAAERGLDDPPRVDGSTVDRPLFEGLDAIAQQPVAGIEIADLEDLVLKATDSHAPEVREP